MTKDIKASARYTRAYEATGLTVAEFARRMQVSQPTVTRWLNGTHSISQENARRFAMISGFSATWILHGADPDGELTAQTGDEIALLRLYREVNGEARAGIIAFIHAIHTRTYTGQ